MIVYGPGPFPPPAPTPDGVVDVAWMVLDELATAAFLGGPGRRGLTERLRAELRAGVGTDASQTMAAFLDSWPLATRVDEARARWRAGPDPAALAVLARAAAVVGRVADWPAVEGAPWPVPTAGWLQQRLGEGDWEVRRRDRTDEAEAVATALGVSVTGSTPLALPPFADVDPAELVPRRAELARRLALGEIDAVRLVGPVPEGPDAQLALGEIRLEGRGQARLDAVGLAGLLVDDLPAFREVLEPAPPGTPAKTLRTTCQAAAFPGTPVDLANGRTRPVVYLLWDGPHPPLALDPSAAPVLAAFREPAPATAAPADVVDQLLQLGALTGVEV